MKNGSTYFLPFNKGYNNGAGNPPNDKGIKTDYLWKEILTKDSLTNIIQNYVTLFEEEVEKILPDGKIQFIEAHAIIKKSESGRVVSIIGTNRNVTEDVLVQEKLKMQNKVLRDIAFIQSHEVRKPLANIMGIIEILNQNGSFNDLEIFNHLVESTKELDTQIRSIVKKANEMDDEVFR